jgi:hypothetical protein
MIVVGCSLDKDPPMWRLLAGMSVLVCLELGASAATQLGYGTVVGIVTDPAGRPAAQTSIVIENLANGLRRFATTDADGRYEIRNVQPGPYRVQVVVGAVEFSHIVTVTPAAVVRVDTPLTTGKVPMEAWNVGVAFYGGAVGSPAIASVYAPSNVTGYFWLSDGSCAVGASNGVPTAQIARAWRGSQVGFSANGTETRLWVLNGTRGMEGPARHY